MIAGAAALFLLAALAQDMEAVPPQPPATEGEARVRRQIVIRSIRLRPQPHIPGRSVEWREGRRVRCVAARAIAGAGRLKQDSVDLILRDRHRLRARLGSTCPALDYYYGFYISPGEDGLVCADREFVRSRMGGRCEIDQFRLLYPVSRRTVP